MSECRVVFLFSLFFFILSLYVVVVVLVFRSDENAFVYISFVYILSFNVDYKVPFWYRMREEEKKNHLHESKSEEQPKKNAIRNEMTQMKRKLIFDLWSMRIEDRCLAVATILLQRLCCRLRFGGNGGGDGGVDFLVGTLLLLLMMMVARVLHSLYWCLCIEIQSQQHKL